MPRERGIGDGWTRWTLPATNLSSASGYDAPERLSSVTQAVIDAEASSAPSTRL